MKALLNRLIASAMLLTATAHGHEVLVGSYTDGASEGIYRYRFDGASGQLDATPLQVQPASNPSWLTLSADRHHLFAVNEQATGKVSAFSLDSAHHLAPLNQVGSQGGEPTHSSLSHDGRFLFVANYGGSTPEGGSLSVLPVKADGRLGAAVQRLRHAASQVNPERQAAPHVHSLVSSPDGRYLFASDLGADRVFSYRYDGNAAQPLSAFDSVALPPGSGPRHLLFSADGKHAWLTLEMSAQVATFEYHDGHLRLIDTAALTDSDDPAAKAGGALHGSADGRFLYVSNRGSVNELLVFAIDPDGGRLTLLQRRSVEGDHPREFSLDPGQRFVLVANQKSDTIVVIRRDTVSGLLGEVVQRFKQAAPSDLKFID
ncbi:lactonase family protein [Pseudomonas sp. Irchel 3E13]|uniref:lactonase family protein n=1 Tax=Pseudomonas sp. Irchel 3E13 TaxID=2008975 RepID=UPI00211447A1|nr:lactonase family protein [Pseudomonas sp. Irchel 3E13]